MAINPYTEAMREAMASAPEEVALIGTLEIYHPSWAGILRFVNDIKPFSARLELSAPSDPNGWVEFTPFSFRAELPSVGDNGAQVLQVKLDNVSLVAFKQLRIADWTQGAISIIYREYTTADLNNPGRYHYTTVSGITVSEQWISLSCIYANYLNRLFPSKSYETANFPAVAL